MKHTGYLVTAALLSAVLCPPARCGRITGYVRQAETRSPMSGVAVRAYPAGRTPGFSAVSDNDGAFVIDGLAAGRYAVFVGARDNSRPQFAVVDVPRDGQAQVNFSLSASVEVDGDSWTQAYPVFYQSFRAAGLGITSLKLKGFGPGRVVRVQMLEGDGPTGRPVGRPKITSPLGGEGEAAVFWSGGEAPTVPGRMYTFRLSADNGGGWIPGVAGRGEAYPLGRAWFGGQPRPLTDLRFAVCEEKDNLTAAYAVAAGRRTVRARAVGQTFVARGKSVLLASSVLSQINSRPVYVRFSIHEKGPGGRQIGPSKTVPVSSDAAVAWLPGEVGVKPGGTYYLHVESFDGADFYAFEEPETYAGGCACNDAIADGQRDLAGWIACEIGEADQARLFATPQAIRAVPLANASFEAGAKGWRIAGSAGAVVGCDGGVIPPWGWEMFGWTKRGEGENSRTIVYQDVKVTKGKRYAFSGSVFTDHIGGRSSDQKVRLVADPTGHGRFTNDAMQSSQWYATEGEWRRGSVVFVAKSDRISVGFELEQRFSQDMCQLYVDGAYLEEVES